MLRVPAKLMFSVLFIDFMLYTVYLWPILEHLGEMTHFVVGGGRNETWFLEPMGRRKGGDGGG